VIPLDAKRAKVKTELVGIIEGERFHLGQLEFPSKQSWTKFYGAIQKGGLGITDLEIRMENVPYDPSDEERGPTPPQREEEPKLNEVPTTKPKFPVFGQPVGGGK
jgi:hypothetical protein